MVQKLKWYVVAIICCLTQLIHAQQTAQVKGSVLSESGEILSGVSITITQSDSKEKQTTTTNEKGIFTINNLKAGGKYNFTFTYVGYQDNVVLNYLVNNGENNSLLVRLKQATSTLDQIVVVGYGTKQRNAVTGAISTINSKEFENRPITQASQIFYGLVPGIFANANTGEAGNGQTTFRVRGVGTLNDASALILVDGIEAPIDNINPNDIESVSVLKDAAAAAIYGSRAANGVVLITTKRGKFNTKPRVDYHGYAGFSSPTVLPKMVNDNALYLQLYKEAATNTNISSSGITDADIERYRNLPSTDWFDILFKKQAAIQEHTVGLRAGNENLSAYLSLGYLSQEGILQKQNFQRYNIRLNIDAKLSSKFKTGVSLAYSYTPANLAVKEGPEYQVNSTDVNSLNGKGSLVFEAAITQHPIVPVYDSLGRYATLEQKLGVQRNRNNGQAILDNEFLQQKDYKFLGNVFAEYEPIKNLKIRTTIGLNNQQLGYVDIRKQYQNFDPVTKNLVSTVVPGSFLTDVQNFTQNVTTLIQASYEKKIKQHNFNVLIGANQESSIIKNNANLQTNFSSTSLITLGNGATTLVARTTQGEWALQSLFGRFGYEFSNKYLFEANIRRDGSSRFGANNRYGIFPSFSAGWIVSSEKFWNKKIINFLKFRASHGTLGNQNTDLYPFASQLSLANNYPINNVNTGGGAINVLGNPNLKWESTTTTDLGINVHLFNSKLTFEVDYFIRNTKDILTAINNPLTLGITAPTINNAASVENKGWELSTNYQFKIGNVNGSVGGNITYVENKVTTINPSLSADADKVELNAPASIWLIRGQPINSIYGYKVVGIFQNTDEISKAPNHALFGTPRPGDFRFQDTDGDGTITNKDRVILGNRQPKWLYGFNTKFSFKSFDISILFQGIGKTNTYQARQVGPFAFAGIREFWKDRWTPDNPSTTMPRIWIDRSGYNGASIETLPSSFWVQNLAYLRLKNLQIGYSIPSKLLLKSKIQQCRFYVNAQNLFTFTKYKDFDPERLTTQQYVTNSLPQLRIVTAGASITF